MPERKSTTKSTSKTKTSGAFTAEELAAMKETARERKAARSGKVDGEADILAKIAEMPPSDRSMAKKVHAIVKETAPDLEPRTWYGMPAYTDKDGKVVCFFQSGAKFKYRYATLGFQDSAHLDDGEMWPASFALTKITPAVEAKIRKLVKKAVG
jgi:uncharacterized protein YdhG (YjbR/CyaY superfamily)